jgi:hypothetical protein
MSLLSLIGYGIAEATFVMARCHYQVMLMMALARRCWPWRDVATESCWRCHCRSDISRGIADDHANVTSGLIYIEVLGK